MAPIASVDQYMDSLAEPLRTLATILRPLIDAGLPATRVQMWHGQPVWMNGRTPVALIKAYPSYITFSLFRGQAVADSSGRLESGSREMASVKLRKADEIDETLFADWLTKANALDLAMPTP